MNPPIASNGYAAHDAPPQMLAELHQKLDALAAQVQYLAEQAKQERQARNEPFDTLMPILNDALRLTGKQLADVQLPDLVRLLKRLARNRQNIERLLDLMEASFEFTDVLAPFGNEVFAKLIAGLSEAERRGYFVFARGGLRILDEIVTSFGEEDIKQLGDNIVLILQTIKQMTQPEVMNFLRRTIVTVEEQAGAPVDISYRALLAQLRDPNVRPGLALILRTLSKIGAEQGGAHKT
jgi:uncharacterized protein YjgD (DUF1641 family)